MPRNDERANSGFWASWSSLPGILTGVAAVIAAVGTLAALFIGGDGGKSPASGAPVAPQPTSASGSGDEVAASGPAMQPASTSTSKGFRATGSAGWKPGLRPTT
jgi:hypothetical protein